MLPRFVIERDIPGIGHSSRKQLAGAAKQSCATLQEMGPQIQWLESYVTEDKSYCVYIAPDEEVIKEHAEKSGFPANKIRQVKSIIDPTTSESG